MSPMKRIFPLACVAVILASCTADNQPSVSDYNLVWDSPSENAAGSMPIGNGELGANLWVEPSGDVVFYLSRTDSWSETGELYKLGRVRISTTPSLTSAGDFRQTLDLLSGRINLKGAGMDLDFFIDSEAQTAHLYGKSTKPVKADVKMEVWRTETVDADPDAFRSVAGYPDPALHRIYPDHMISEDGALMVYHHNECSSYDAILDYEGIEIENRASHDPFLDRCFGYRIEGVGMQKASDTELVSSSDLKSVDIRISTFCDILHDEASREADIRTLLADKTASRDALKRTAAFWNSFWNRSYIFVQTPDPQTAHDINSSYILQRWIQACGGRGNYAIKFNGTIFTVDPQFTDPDFEGNPDARRWGGDFWWQNTRLNYYPMLKSGDYDMMKPLFEHYFRNLEMMKANGRALAGVDGAISPETATVFGTYCYNDYTQIGNFGDKFAQNPFIRFHWDSSLEMISLMLDYYDYTGDREFVQNRIVPYAREFLKFYLNFYGRDESGRLLITPTQSLETYWYDVVNDLPTVAGLNDVVPRLLTLPAELSDSSDKALWTEMSAALPEIPLMQKNGKTEFAPAGSYRDVRTNCENPDLYAIFPFHLCNISTPDLQIGIDTYWDRIEKRDCGWTQDGQEAARLGLTDEAAANLIAHARNDNPAFRFPAFWGPNFDWTPDQDHGASLLMILQEMVLQTWDGEDYELPAFPEDWGVKYKLHSTGGRIVKGECNWKN